MNTCRRSISVRDLLSVVLNPRKPTFNVTDKGQSLDKDHLSRAFDAVLRFVRRLRGLDAGLRLALVHRARRQRIARCGRDVEPLQSHYVGRGARRRLGTADRADADRPTRAPGAWTGNSCGARARYLLWRLQCVSARRPFPIRASHRRRRRARRRTQALRRRLAEPAGQSHACSGGGGGPARRLRLRQADAAPLPRRRRHDVWRRQGYRAFRSGRRGRHGIVFGVYVFISWGALGTARGLQLLRSRIAEARARRRKPPPPYPRSKSPRSPKAVTQPRPPAPPRSSTRRNRERHAAASRPDRSHPRRRRLGRARARSDRRPRGSIHRLGPIASAAIRGRNQRADMADLCHDGAGADARAHPPDVLQRHLRHARDVEADDFRQ